MALKTFYSEFYPGVGSGVKGTTTPAMTEDRVSQLVEDIGLAIGDSILTRDEKIRILIPTEQELDVTYANLQQQATSLNISIVALNSVRSIWKTYLATLTPEWDDTSADTTIDRDEFRTKINGYLAELAAVQKAATLEAAKRADIAGGLTNDGAPVNRSDVLTREGIAAGIEGQGSGATANSLQELNPVDFADLQDVKTLSNATRDRVESLEATYGDTASAAQSAIDAAASEAAAAAAKADAIIAKGEAQTSASTAIQKATDAAGSASAALTSKNNAATSATTATNKAQDATNAAASATTQAGLAAGSASAALTSKNDAATSATTATTKAQDATSAAASATMQAGLAAGSATAAGGSATAAAGSASTAGTKANEAGNSAAAANASKVAAEAAFASAKAVAIAGMPDAPTASTMTQDAAGSAETRSDLPVTAAGGNTISTGVPNLFFKGLLPWVQGRVYELEFRIEGIGTALGHAGLYYNVLKTDLTTRTQGWSLPAVPTPVGSVTTLKQRVSMGIVTPGAFPITQHADNAFIRIGALINRIPSGNTGQTGAASKIHLTAIRDITALAAAEAQASAAATSSSNAAASATLAGEKATAAQQSATNAETSRAGAATSASQASTSETNAAGSANAASLSAGAAATSRDQASGFSTAASGHANTAGTKATEAGNSAAAAAASKVAAESARDASQGSATASAASAASAATSADAAGTSASAANTAKLAAESARAQAQSFRDEAASSATNAAGSAATASSAAGQSVTAKDQAQGFATAANTSAQNAAGSATAAGNSASAANTSKTAAEAAYSSAVAAAIAGFPDVLAADLLTGQLTGSPTAVPALNSAWFSAAGITTPSSTQGFALYKQTVPWKSGEVYEFDYEVEGLTGTSFAAVYGQYLNVSFAGTVGRNAPYIATPNGVKTRIVQRIALDRTVVGATTWTLAGTGTDRLRFGVLFNRTNTGSTASGQARLTRMTVRNVTGLVDTQSVYDKTIILGGNQGFEDGLTGWLEGLSATISGTPLSAAHGTYYASYNGASGVFLPNPGVRRDVATEKLFPVDTTRKYRIRTRFFVGPDAPVQVYIGKSSRLADGAAAGSNTGLGYDAVAGTVFPAGTGWVERVSGIITGESAEGGSGETNKFRFGTKLVRLIALLNYAPVTGAFAALDGIWLEDVTESEAAKAQAAAAATSASNAAASSTTAGQQATAAQTAKTAAETAKGLSETAASQASSSATNAAGSASTASTAATNAATSRDQASGFATAASGSASTAATKANEAGNSATAAAASQVSASAAKDAAVSAAIALMPDVIAADLLTDAGAAGAPASKPNLPSAQVANGTVTSLVGTSQGAHFKAVVPWKVGEIYEVMIDVDGLAGSTAPTASPYAARLKSNYAAATAPYEFYSWVNTPAGQTTRRVIRFGLDVTPPAPSGVAAVKITASADAAFVRLGALFNYGTAADRQSRLKLLTVRNVTAQVAAETSATAAATSASNASASATTAGEKATAASGSAATAATKAGEASTFANQAASSASGAAGSATTASSASGTAVTARDTAIGARNDAQTAAATAISQAATASSSAAAASVSANLAASMANANPNALPNSTGLGMEGWYNTSPNGEVITAQQSPDGPRFAFGFTGVEGAWSEPRYRSEKIAWYPGISTSISAEVLAIGMKWGDIRFYLEFFNAADQSLGYQVAKHAGSTDWRKIQSDGVPAPANTAYIRATIDTLAAPWNVGGSAYWRKLKVENSSESTPWNDSAQSQMVAEVLAKADYLQARWKQVNAVPGAATFITAEAENNDGTPNSSVAIGARQVMLYNQIGGDWKKALEVINGNALFSGGLQAGAYIRLGNGNGWPVALKPVDFQATDGEVVNFGTDLGSLPSISFALNNLAPLNAGETYNVYAENLSATGFTLRAKINIPATPSNQQSSQYTYNETLFGYPGMSIYLEGKPPSPSGSYRVVANGYQEHRFLGMGGGAIETDREDRVYTTLQIWAYNGAWVKVADITAESLVDPYQFPPNQRHIANGSWYIDETLQMISGVTHIHICRVGADNGRAGQISRLGPIYWQAQGTGTGVRSATPNGQKTNITVRPQ